jgi:hypothetical protein
MVNNTGFPLFRVREKRKGLKVSENGFGCFEWVVACWAWAGRTALRLLKVEAR